MNSLSTSVKPSTFFLLRTANFSHFHTKFFAFSRDCRRGRSETICALNFYTLLDTAAAKSTTLSASKTACARLPRPPVVALINQPTSIVKFNKVQQSGTQHDGILSRGKLLRRTYLTLLRHFEVYLSLCVIFFFHNHAKRLILLSLQLAEFNGDDVDGVLVRI